MFRKTLEENIKIKRKLIKLENKINIIINLITNCLQKKGKVLICGNGGSAADAQHLAAEFLIRLRPKVNRAPKKTAKKNKITSIGFLGSGGGEAKKLSNYSLVVPSSITARIQECHIFLGHFIFEQVENNLIN